MVDCCVYCHNKLIGWFSVDYWGNKFCIEHKKDYPSCDYCGRLIPPFQQSSQLKFAGRKVCNVCRMTAVDHIADARQHFQEIISWINREGLNFNELSLKIQFQNQHDLTAFMQSPAKRVLGAASRQKVSNRGKQVNEVGCVAIRRGLPKPLFQGVTIHELTHVWCTVHEVISLPEWAEEGFCELLAYRYYTQLLSPEGKFYAMNISKNPDPIYGQGFRLMKRIADQMTFPVLIRNLIINKELPVGFPVK